MDNIFELLADVDIVDVDMAGEGIITLSLAK